MALNNDFEGQIFYCPRCGQPTRKEDALVGKIAGIQFLSHGYLCTNSNCNFFFEPLGWMDKPETPEILV